MVKTTLASIGALASAENSLPNHVLQRPMQNTDDLGKSLYLERFWLSVKDEQVVPSIYHNNRKGHVRDKRSTRVTKEKINVSETVDEDDKVFQVSSLIWQTVKDHVGGCLFILATDDPQKDFVMQLIRLVSLESQTLIILDMSKLGMETPENLLRSLLYADKTVCRTLLLDLTAGGETALFRLLASANLWLWSEAWIVMVGERARVDASLRDRTFRNVRYLMYLSLPEPLLESLVLPDKRQALHPSLNKQQGILYDVNDTAVLYGLCQFCESGKPGIRLLFSWWPLKKTLPTSFVPFPNQLENLQGLHLRVVMMPNFPYNDYQVVKNGSETKLIWFDSVDKKMLAIYSAKMNFT
ncbi:hypothetical protein SK128_005682 [Halocaridina rubra]|uniref:Uncharacterized protein n=1 Tax=Halocaridina rubra TaxID=373956 RepID=A0AAN8ZYJ1_HALRR